MELRDKVVTQEIDGIAYTSTKLSAADGLAILPKLVEALGETFVKIAALGKLEVLAQRPDVIAELVVSVAGKLDEAGLLGLSKRLLKRTKCAQIRVPGAGGGELLPHFDNHFSGEYVHLFKVLAFVVQHNFAGFTLGVSSTSGSEMAPDEANTAA